MHDPRTPTALRQLAHLADPPPPTRWHWSIARLDRAGRVALPRHARTALTVPDGAPCSIRARLHRGGLVLGAGSGASVSVTVDGRGRLAVPIALRSTDVLVVGTRTADGLVVIASGTVVDGLGDVLAGDRP